MSYHIYSTIGIVLKRKTFGESDTVLSILTQDLGLVLASAKSTRTLQSKLKGSLQEYSLSNVSMVKGKNGWKITNASLIKNYYFDSPEYSKKIFAKISLILQKNITGELFHKEVFDIVRTGFDSVIETNIDNIQYIETLMVLRIMKELGYVALNDSNKIYFSDYSSWGDKILGVVSENKLSIVSLINKAIKESQL
jgi:DNA repair protein RecO (recombination protein O)